ncbi:MAG: serine hydrolase, partial [Actinomycetota bacterium]|nr:serine hydrolase [Actinomycetota bacterium]
MVQEAQDAIQERVRGVLQSAVEEGDVPGAVALVRRGGRKVLHEAYGWAQLWPEPRPMQGDAVFDLASLTKPLAAAAVSLALVDRGALSLDEELTRHLPELRTARGAGVTARRVLSHTSGLPGWRPLYTWATGREGMLRAIDDLGMAYQPGSRFEYSDLGFIALGIALERIGGQRLDALAEELVFRPCGLHSTTYLPQFDGHRFAVTERGNEFERSMAEWAGLSFGGWRETTHPGQVNDGNAHYGLEGVSGHAGLFSDAEGVGVLGQMWLDRGDCNGRGVLSEAGVELSTTRQTPLGEAARGLGWSLASRTAPGREELTRADAGLF